MTLSRRKTLALIGGGGILAAGAGAATFATTRTPHAALAPWVAAGTYADARLNALSWALLAPNPHNLQPWQAELVGDDAVRIWREAGRILPHTDPYERQITIGMGCFLELMVIAASASGHGVDLTLYPQGPDGPVAHAIFRAGAATEDPLFRHAPDRRSCKEPFADRSVPGDLTGQLSRLAQVHTDPQMVAALRALTWDAFAIEVETPHTYRESVDLMRFGRAEIEANPDGIDLGGPFLESLILAGVLTRAAQLDPTSTAYRTGIDMYRTMLAATPAYVSLTSAGNTRADQIAAGRQWMRLNLTTTAMGLGLQPVSQALQEYPEMAEPYARAHDLLADPGETVQMLGRLGYGPVTPRSPRWPLSARMRDA